MRFGLSDDQRAIRDSARAFLAKEAPAWRGREVEADFDEAVWARLSGELGWTSLPFAEEVGGAGLSWIEVAVVMEEMGRALYRGPYLSSVCLAGSAIALAGTEAQRAEHLPGICDGSTRGALVAPAAGQPLPSLAIAGDEVVLSGGARFVVDGASATLLVVAASRGDGDVSLVVVPPDAPGVQRTRLATMDATRRLADVALADVRLPRSAVLGELGGASGALSATLDRAAIALAAEQVGGADRCLEMAVEYAKTRVQFGKPIGSFQAVKHACADMLVDVEMARAAAYYGAYVVASSGADLALAASQAKATASEAFFRCAGQNIQVHGGIGFTWEHDAHLFFKRARAGTTLLGEPSFHRARYADEMGIGR